jgi:WD40 repeat protein
MRVRAPGFRIGASYSVAFSPDGEHLAVVGRDVVLWSVSRRKRLRSSRLLSNPSAAVFAPDGSSFVVKNTGGEFLVCETASADPIARARPAARDEGTAPLYASGTAIVDGSWSGEIRERNVRDLAKPRVLWRGEHQMILQVLQAAGVWAFPVSVKHGHPAFESQAAGDQVFISNALGLTPLRTLGPIWDTLRSASLSPQGERIAVRSGTTAPKLEILTVAEGSAIAVGVSKFGGTGYEHAWSPDGSIVVTIEEGGFSFRESKQLEEVGWIPSDYPAAVSFSPDGCLIALGDWRRGFVSDWASLLAELPSREQPPLRM